VHRYYFRLYALGEKLALEAGKDKRALLRAMSEQILDEAELMGTYER
jgi:hypothetical protein